MAAAQKPPASPVPANAKPPIYLLDSMAFIFRAYHAMQRSRPMSTRTGIPTAATYVFVNMINKLRKDFSPAYFAAIYDVGAPVHRNEMAAQMKDVQKFNIKTQAFETIEYGGYKANRAETPPDLIQQQPYIRRALEAFRIPILYYEGFEADDVIGTLSCQLSSLGHHVYVVSPDKDMMQLVNENVSILNPTKDNLVLDAAKVEEVLGVPPSASSTSWLSAATPSTTSPEPPASATKAPSSSSSNSAPSKPPSTEPKRSKRRPTASPSRTTATTSSSRRN